MDVVVLLQQQMKRSYLHGIVRCYVLLSCTPYKIILVLSIYLHSICLSRTSIEGSTTDSSKHIVDMTLDVLFLGSFCNFDSTTNTGSVTPLMGCTF